MKNWKTIEIPKLIKDNCKIDKRGLIVPFVVLEDNFGEFHFKVNDNIKQIKAIKENLCAICGTELKEDMWLIGGPGSAFHNNGCYIDSCSHYECSRYALQVCPYLAYSGYNSKTDILKIQEQIDADLLLDNPTVDNNRVPLFVLSKIKSFEYKNGYIYPRKPYIDVQFWNNGIQLDDYQAIKIIINHFSEKGYVNIKDYKI